MKISKHVYVETNTVILMKMFLSKYLKFLFSKSNYLLCSIIIIIQFVIVTDSEAIVHCHISYSVLLIKSTVVYTCMTCILYHDGNIV